MATRALLAVLALLVLLAMLAVLAVLVWRYTRPRVAPLRGAVPRADSLTPPILYTVRPATPAHVAP